VSSCEKCWRDAAGSSDPVMRYVELLSARYDHPCTPEEQAGPDAQKCPGCGRMTLHQWSRQPMCGCVPSPMFASHVALK
jgi:hypothetical protein